jgi:hypothetical protein
LSSSSSSERTFCAAASVNNTWGSFIVGALRA